MRSGRLLVYAISILLPAAAFATGVTSTTGTSAANTAQVSITITAVIAIDVESNVTFDFNTYSAPSGPTDCANKFPPGADCTTVTYSPSNVTIPASGTAGQIWLAIFSNASGHQATMTVTVFGDAAFSSNPGFTPQAIQLTGGTTNVAVNGKTFVPSGTAIGTSASPVDIGSSTMTSSVFPWSRIDQIARLSLSATTSFNVVTGSTANITFTLKY